MKLQYSIPLQGAYCEKPTFQCLCTNTLASTNPPIVKLNISASVGSFRSWPHFSYTAPTPSMALELPVQSTTSASIMSTALLLAAQFKQGTAAFQHLKAWNSSIF